MLTGKGWISYRTSNTAAASVAESAEPAVGRGCGCPVDTSLQSREATTEPAGETLPPAAESDAGYAFAKRLLGENIQSVDMSAKKLSGKPNRKISAYGANSTSSGVLDDRINIVSDEIGNPIEVDGLQYRWNGRQLQGISIDGTEVLTYAYNTDGQRTKKVFSLPDDGICHTYEYFYNGSILAGQKLTKVENGEETTYTLAFMYDNNGDIFGFYYNDTPYYYIKNAQNDVVMVVNTDGVAEVVYLYDAWGNISNCYEMPGSNMSEINPLTYRSYYYDAELGMYYLNSRYYMPTLCRFLNADDSDIIDGGNDHALENNLFAYCLNNPIVFSDDDGEWVHLAIGAAIGAITSVVGAAISGERGWSLALSAVTGAVSGALAASGVGLVGQVVGGAAIGAVGNLIDQKAIKKSKKIDAKSLLVDTVIGGVSGALGGKGASRGNSKSAMKLGKQLTKNVKNSIKYNKKSIANSYQYYMKNMHTVGGKSIYKNLFVGSSKSGGWTVATSLWKRWR